MSGNILEITPLRVRVWVSVCVSKQDELSGGVEKYFQVSGRSAVSGGGLQEALK